MKSIHGLGCICGISKGKGIGCEWYWFSMICGLYCIIKMGRSRWRGFY